DSEAASDRGCLLDVDAFLRAVARDVRVDDAAGAGALALARQLDRVGAAGLGPALDGDLAVASIDADGNAPGQALTGLPQNVGLRERDGAENDAIDAGFDELHGALDAA